MRAPAAALSSGVASGVAIDAAQAVGQHWEATWSNPTDRLMPTKPAADTESWLAAMTA